MSVTLDHCVLLIQLYNNLFPI